MNTPITITEIENFKKIKKNFPKMKVQDLMASKVNSIKHSEKS